jgi:hypothetical protein
MGTGKARIAKHKVSRTRRFATILIALAATLISTVMAQRDKPVNPCDQSTPPGFRPIAALPEGPWAFDGSGTSSRVLPMLNYRATEKGARTITLNLDDGTRGVVHVEGRACKPGEDCSPYDCGCTNPDESYWIEIRRPNGTTIARKHLWAAYQEFQLVPVDLVDGPGDELLIARIPAHASPPTGWDLQIWQLRSQLTEIGAMRLTKSLYSIPFGCARWAAALTLDPKGAKPRPMNVIVDFTVNGCCRLDSSEARRVADLKRPHVLRFDSKSGRYVLTGLAPGAFSH